MSDPFVGEIRMLGFPYAPYGWAFCNGQLMQISQNTTLFSVIGTTYGGDGQATFALPNLQGASPMHWGSGAGLTPCVVGEAQGTAMVTLTQSQMPSHNHLVQSAQAGAATQETGTPDNTAYIGNSAPGQAYNGTVASLDSQFSQKAIGMTGGSQPHPNQQPLLTLNACIALFGVFPARN